MNDSQGIGSTDSGSMLARVRALFDPVAIAIVLLLFGLPLFIGLGWTDLRNDEAIYSYAVDRILETGNWLSPESIPHSNHPGDPVDEGIETFLEKPPLKFWIVAASIRLGMLPHNEFGLRFWDALFGMLAFVYIYLIGRRLVGNVCGLAAVFLLFGQAPLLFAHGLRSNVMDAALVLAYAAGICHFLAWKHSVRSARRTLHIYAIVGWFAFGFMMKFVAAIFLPMMIGVVALLSSETRRLLRHTRWHWIVAALIAILLMMPWFVYQYVQQGSRLWQVMLGAHVVERFTTSLDPDHVKPAEFYFTELRASLGASGSLGWVTFGCLLWVAEAFRRRSADWALIPIWYFLPVGLISLGSSKLYYYTYPFQAGLMVMGAYPVWILVVLALGKDTGVVWIDTLRKRWVGLIESRAARYGRSSYGRGIAALTLAAPLVIFIPHMPLKQYGEIIEQTRGVDRPLSTTRDCVLNRVEALRRASPGRRSRIYAHLPPGEGLTHDYYYYYRMLDEWERPASYSRTHLYRRLFVDGQRAPTFILEDEYRAFLRELDDSRSAERIEPAAMLGDDLAGARTLVDLVAAGELPGMVALQATGTRRALLLLPGPFRVCEDPGLAAGGEPVAIEFIATSKN